MPELLDEERLTQEELLRLREEEDRLRREQEALAAQQQMLLAPVGVPAEIPPPAIAFDQFGASMPPAPGGSFLPAAGGGYTTDSPQYTAEVARARAGSGFINADVGPGGNVIAAGYDPAIAEAAQRQQQAKLAAQAERFNGAQGYQQSLQSGATPAEALALWGSKMFAGDPKGLVNLATRREPLKSSLEPEVTNVDGVKMYRTGPNSFAQARPELPAKPPPESVAGQKILTGQITDARNALERAEKRVAEDYKPEAGAVNAALRARSKLRGLEENFMRGSTQWMGSATAPAKQAAAPAKADEQVVVVKDGRRYSLPKSQLEEALKAGYKAL